MKEIYLLRHAKSSWDYANLKDHERPLNQRGMEDAKCIGDFFKENNIVPDLILCSTALRTRTTLEIIQKESTGFFNIIYDKRIYDYDAYLIIQIIKKIENEHNKILIIGHNPDMINLVEKFIQERFPYPKYSTAGFTLIKFDMDDWDDISSTKGKLDFFVCPKMIKQ